MRRLITVSLATIALIACISVVSCSNYQKILNSDDIEKKYEAAKEYYNKDQYAKALPLFEDLLAFYRGTPRGEKITFYYAYCQYGVGNLQIASFRFKNFYETYPNSEYAKESLFMFAYCLYLESPPIRLDQSSTQKAIQAFQYYIIKFPASEKIEECNTYIDQLRKKLEQKSINQALLYFKIKDYKAAAWALQNVLEQYPATEEREELTFMALKANYLLALNSIDSKVEERLYTALQIYRNFAENFPDSDYLAEAMDIQENIKEQLEKFNRL